MKLRMTWLPLLRFLLTCMALRSLGVGGVLSGSGVGVLLSAGDGKVGIGCDVLHGGSAETASAGRVFG